LQSSDSESEDEFVVRKVEQVQGGVGGDVVDVDDGQEGELKRQSHLGSEKEAQSSPMKEQWTSSVSFPVKTASLL
jgi:hypothetical protein